MSLITRFSFLMLTLLAVVLCGFSLTLYWWISGYLSHEAEERLQFGLANLQRRVIEGEDGIRWSLPRTDFSFEDPTPGADPLCWIVLDHRGKLLEQSANLRRKANLTKWLSTKRPNGAIEKSEFQDTPWLTLSISIRPSWFEPKDSDEEERKSPAITIVLGDSQVPVRAAQRNLAWTLIGLSVGIWLLCALCIRKIGKRALIPVARMAQVVNEIQALEPEQRLPTTGTFDELQCLGDNFNDLLDRLRESFERQSRFTGEAAHQLRTPLTALLGQVEVALRKSRDPEQYRSVLNKVHEQGSRLHQIVEALLFLARADHDSAQPVLEDLELGQWLDEELVTWQEHARINDITVVKEEALCWIRGHRSLLSQILFVLLDNACKHSEPGDSIIISLQTSDTEVILSVEDKGIGIPEDDIPHVLEPFYRSEQVRQKGLPGTGLGLTIAHRIARTLDADFCVESMQGEGSKVSLCFNLIITPGENRISS